MRKKFSNVEHEVIYNKLAKGLREQDLYVREESTYEPHQYLTELHRLINTLQKTRENHAHRFIQSHRKVTGRFIVFAKKVVRKLLKWYVQPIAWQQTEFNNAVTPAIGRLTELVTGLLEKIKELEQIKLEMEELKTLNSQVKQEFSFKEQEFTFKEQEFASKEQKLLVKIEERDKKIAEQLEHFTKKQALYEENNIKTIDFIEMLQSENIFAGGTDNFFVKKTYAQSGEDGIIAYILHVLGIPNEKVDYIDLGANHAKELSNTYYFYSKGAKGVLIEANTELIPELKFFRHRDIILNNCIDVESDKEIDFYILNGDGLSTTDFEAATKFCEINPALKIIDKKTVKTISYSTIIEQYLGKAPTILSIDIEGKDMEILKSIDFENYRPLIIVTEMINYDIDLNHKSKNSTIKEFLANMEYEEYAFTGINSIFLDKRFLKERNSMNEYSN